MTVPPTGPRVSPARYVLVDVEDYLGWALLFNRLQELGSLDDVPGATLLEAIRDWLLRGALVDPTAEADVALVLADWVALMPSVLPPPTADTLAYLRLLGLDDVRAAVATTYRSLGAHERRGEPMLDVHRYWHGCCLMMLQRRERSA